MQWSAERNAGFSEGKPWLPLSADRETRNVETLRNDPRSLLTLYRRLIALRREHLALSIGDYASGGVEGNVLWFERRYGETRLMVALNFGQKAVTVRLPNDANVLLSTYVDRESVPVRIELALRIDEGVILAL